MNTQPHRSRLALAATRFLVAALAFQVSLPALVGAQISPDSVRSVRARQGMVVSEHPLASQAGLEVLRAGGNAVDAAVATGFALAVTHPAAGNIGGGGFMVIRFPDGRTTAIDFRERGPAASHPEMWLVDGQYSNQAHHSTHRAVGVPGTVAGFDHAQRLYGRVEWERVVSPAVSLAGDGFALSDRLARGLAGLVNGKGQQYSGTVAAFSRNGTPYTAGETFRQPDLARTLTRIRDQGRDGFYKGETARLLAEEMRRGGGLITEVDLASYQPRERTPVVGSYRGYDVISMPPPSSGGVALVQMLNILEGYDLASLGYNSSRYAHLLAESMRVAYRDRARWLADPDYADVPVQRLTSKTYADGLRATIDRRQAGSSSPEDAATVRVATDVESPETTHYSVVDGDGMAVSVTYTLEQSYGVGITVPGAGFLLNNEMGDFNAAPDLTTDAGLIGTVPNLARPGQRMLSSMTPTILAKDGQLVAVIGSPGGRTIINTVLNIVLAHIDFRMSPEESVAAGRTHHQWLPDRLNIEGGTFTLQAVRVLEEMGHTVRMQGTQGIANSIFIDPATNERVGVPDPRNPDGRGAGY